MMTPEEIQTRLAAAVDALAAAEDAGADSQTILACAYRVCVWSQVGGPQLLGENDRLEALLAVAEAGPTVPK